MLHTGRWEGGAIEDAFKKVLLGKVSAESVRPASSLLLGAL